MIRWEVAREIARHGYWQLGHVERGARMDKARRHIIATAHAAERGELALIEHDDPARFSPHSFRNQQKLVRVIVSPKGRYFIEDGRHRLHAADELDLPILVDWRRGHPGLDLPPGVDDVLVKRRDL